MSAGWTSPAALAVCGPIKKGRVYGLRRRLERGGAHTCTPVAGSRTAGSAGVPEAVRPRSPKGYSTGGWTRRGRAVGLLRRVDQRAGPRLPLWPQASAAPATALTRIPAQEPPLPVGASPIRRRAAAGPTAASPAVSGTQSVHGLLQRLVRRLFLGAQQTSWSAGWARVVDKVDGPASGRPGCPSPRARDGSYQRQRLWPQKLGYHGAP